jgi:hypothetical protein
MLVAPVLLERWEFDRHAPAQMGVLGDVDFPHPAPAELL